MADNAAKNLLNRIAFLIRTVSPETGGEILKNIEQTANRVKNEFERLESSGAEEAAAHRFMEMFRRFVDNTERKMEDTWFSRRYVAFLKQYLSDLESLLAGGPNDPYKVLGSQPSDDTEQIKLKYRKLARRYHPDRPDGDHRKMQEINLAYQTILKLRGEK